MKLRQIRRRAALTLATLAGIGLAALAGVACGGSPSGAEAGPGASLGPSYEGQGTYYSADGTGNCSFDASPGDLLVAAMNEEQYGNAELCGACVAVQGPRGEVTVRIVDRCPGCKRGDLDLSPQAFERIAPLSAGRVPVAWRLAPCAVDGPIAYKYKEGSNPYWIALQVRNHRVAVASLELRQGERWVPLQRERYNYFVGGEGDGPLLVRVTSTTGVTLEDELPAVNPGAVVQGKAQFP